MIIGDNHGGHKNSCQEIMHAEVAKAIGNSQIREEICMHIDQ